MDRIKIRFKPTYIPRIMPVGGIIILLMMMLPQIVGHRPGRRSAIGVEPPLVLKYYDTGYAKTDSLLNAGLRSFSQKRYDDAAGVLSRVHFYWTAAIREKRLKAYPEDLLFYLGLSHLYRGYPALAAPLLEEGEAASPFDEKYPWYLAHAYLAEGRPDKARAELEKVVKLGGRLAGEAERKLGEVGAPDEAPGR